MADANDGRVTLWRNYGGNVFCTDAVPFDEGRPREWYIARPRADDDAREERLKRAECSAVEGWTAAEMHKARAEQAEEDAAARGRLLDAHREGCEWKARATKAEADRDRARALLKEARPHVQHSIDEGAETGIELLASIDAETRGEG